MMLEILKILLYSVLVGIVFYVLDAKLHKEAWRKGFTQGYLEGQLDTLAKLKIIYPNIIKEKEDDETTD